MEAIDKSRRLGTFWPALILLAVCALINYVDRGNLSIAAPLLIDELHISTAQLGILLSGFFWTYTAMQFVSGWLVDRFDVNRVIAIGYLVWSIATAVTGVVHGFTLLLVMRLTLGIGESVVFPSFSKILAQQLPEHDRGFANGLIQGAMRSGPAVGTLGAGLAMARYGWRPMFIGLGLMSLAWLPAWRKWKPTGGGTLRSLTASPFTASPGLTDILRQRSFWGACAGNFSVAYLLYFMLVWLPFYLVRERHLSLSTMAKTASLYYLVDAASALASGWLSDFCIRRGGTPTVVRKSVMAIGITIAAIAVGRCIVAGPHTYLMWLLVAGVGSGMAGSGPFAFAQTLAGPEAAGRWTGTQNGFANLAGVAAPAVTGVLVDRTGSFLIPFAITAAVLVAGGFAWIFAVGRVEQVSWASKHRRLPAAIVGGS